MNNTNNSVLRENIPADLRGPVLIAGAGVSGTATARMCEAIGVEYSLVDDRAQGALDTQTALARLEHYSLVVTSPGWRPETELFEQARLREIPVLGDVELAWRLDQAGVFGPRRTWLAVTGTNGKTTTTAMLAAMMQRGGFRAQAVGNIGTAVGDVLSEAGEARVDVLVAELSSFQLYWSQRFTPDAGVLLNLAEDHLDWHGSYAAYAAAKAKALRGPVAVAGMDSPEVRDLVRAEGLEEKIIPFGLSKPAPGGVGVLGGHLVDAMTLRGGEENPDAQAAPIALAPVEGIEPAGPAGVLDALAAAAVARSQGVSPEAIAEALRDFHVAGHRGHVVSEHGGVRWVDNSKATNPHAAEAALAAEESVVWVAGGQLKGADVTDLVRGYGSRMRAAIVLGQDRGLIEEALRAHAPQVEVHSVAETDPRAAMMAVGKIAQRVARPGDTVLLAPAAASLDMYTGMGQRGDMFAAAALRAAAEQGTQGVDSGGVDKQVTAEPEPPSR
ncbi:MULTISPECIES: UDP-N-acetylmuramoyl-L-alanine--D-glutamate ligase [unclassified Corynebacterium]|uniref:UDP-N-acetylmuramoyl-L-alanine--D-glutamate ligase n=1 Tax=unclassified Corynebacterium TaxID=2624378 RepID=UPI0029CA163E|nr:MULTISPECIES: UDP-N-acetylmuramoyl-L-alanine--D-glutamate ligase [unclassified Corynebacterium]WPF65443.1 UDP-N-acetylmuramoyl-L-alanine--D-glutamate ligase [Corynebacterium sp. 22KM0430]WPF67939.1 UDP-N-acetylmuramoyl-L-alanine--D-glutamate ligase [Corynebacterium sp. 21KM1197]